MNIEDYKKKSCFTTPDGYFEALNREIKEATCNSSATHSKRRSLTHRVASLMGYAAAIAIAVIIATGITRNSDTGNIQATINELDDSEYIDNMLTNYPIDEYTFYCYLTGNE
jgi:hypothetical protein